MHKKNIHSANKLLSYIIRLYLVSFLFLILTGCTSTRSSFVKKNLKAHLLEDHFTGFSLYDPEKKTYMYNYNATKYFTPASNVKILSLYAALSTIGDSIPGLRYFGRGDSLFITGTGDPTLMHPFFKQSVTLDFIKNHSASTVVLSTSNFYDQAYAPGWAWEDFTYSFMPERSAFPMYGNLVSFYRKNDSLNITPGFFKSQTLSEERVFKRAFHDQKFYIPENIKDTVMVPFITNDSLVSVLLSEDIDKPVICSNILQPEYKTLLSIPSDSVYRYMMHESDNFIAEQLLLIASGVHSDSLHAKSFINHMLRGAFKNMPQRPRWVDGSGLSRYNLLTPKSIVFVLDKLYREVAGEQLFNWFPAGGETGTIKSWYAADRPYVYAKSGSLSNNYCLSGYLIAKSGKVLIFSYMANHFLQPSSEIKTQLEAFLWEIHNRF